MGPRLNANASCSESGLNVLKNRLISSESFLGVAMDRQAKHLLEFGPFRMDLEERVLMRDQQTITLSPKTFETLLVLVHHSERVVLKDDLMKILWPDTFVEESNLSQHIFQLRKALGDKAHDPEYIVTVPGRGYRFALKVREVSDGGDLVVRSRSLQTVTVEETESRQSGAAIALFARLRQRPWSWILGVAAVVALLTAGTFFYMRKAHTLSEKDTIVLADFANSTGDAVFDGTLRQGLAIQLAQSPFLNIVSDEKLSETLHFMGQPPDARLAPAIARDLCQRTGSKAYLSGSIGSLGTQYVLGLSAVNCLTGDALAQELVTADSKERVLKVLGEAAARMRAKLGESLSTVQKLDTPLEQATTSSLEALQAYSLGLRTGERTGGNAAAVPFYLRAIRLDPNFAMAYLKIGVSYYNLGESSLAAENTKSAYELRERVSDLEKFAIESHYYQLVTGDLEKARQVYELWTQIYPRNTAPPVNLAGIYRNLGQYDKSLADMRESVRLDPADSQNYADLVDSYTVVNRLEEARAMAEAAPGKNLDSPGLRFALYQLAFLQNDTAAMERQVAWAAGKTGVEDFLLYSQADSAAYSGQLGKAREFSRRAVASAKLAKENETAAGYEAGAAMREVLVGTLSEARHRAIAALGLSTGRDVQDGAALALAKAGDVARAQVLADDLAKRFPEDTTVQFNYLPTLRGQLALSRNDPAKAIDVLKAAVPYELGTPGNGEFSPGLYPVYVRGEAYLAAHKGNEAAGEFQKILDHRGVVQNGPIGALAHLGIARAYVMQGDTVKARAAYQDFLTLWKDADPDVPILIAAKAEHAKLQ
jgi:DNA-binding winged helix-turn-helix (wHTH) protein/tetratricopeptide (TPR) repeat protein